VVPADEPALAPLPDLTGWLGRSGCVVTSPAGRCRVADAPVDARLGPWDLGEWTGRPLRDLDLLAWRTDPAFAGHGGESLLAMSERVRLLLADWHRRPGRLAAVTHAPVIKLAVVQALRAPVQAVWDLDVAPGSTTELHSTPSGWRVTAVSCR
jgi:broad specificity phosphatase PhoE